jgi:hypothetical protein
MRKMTVCLVAVAVLTVANVQYYEALFVKFKPGMADQAWDAIYEHFINVDKKLGRKVRAYDLQTGGWNMVVFFPIDGPDNLSWSTSPEDEEWFAALAEQEGGAEKAWEVFNKYLEAVADSKFELAHRHLEIDQE